MLTTQDIYNILTLLALIISAISLYLQLKVRGPKIDLLNVKDFQRRVPRYYKDLPKDIQERFPDISDVAPGYTLVKLIFGNSGDRVGIAIIQEVKIVQPVESEDIKIKA